MTTKLFPTDFATAAFAVGMLLLGDNGAANIAAGPLGQAAVDVLNSTSVINAAQGLSATGGVKIKNSTDNTKVLAFDTSTQATATTTTLKTGAQTGSFSVTIPVLTGNSTLAITSGGALPTGQIAVSDGVALTGNANFIFDGTSLGLGTATPAAKLDIIGLDLSAAADQSVASIYAHTTLIKNNANVRTFYGTLYKPTFNLGASNASTTYNVLGVDSINTSLTGMTVNLLSLRFGGTLGFLVDSSGKVTAPRSGAGTGDYTLGLTGAPINNATSSQVRLGSAIAGGNVAANGGTYFGINGAAAGAGSAADLMLVQANGLDLLRIQANRFMRINGATDDGASPPAALSIASTVVGQNYALYLDNNSDTGGLGALVIRTQGLVGAAKVICLRNSAHATNFTWVIGSLGAMSWGTGDAARDVGLSRSLTEANCLLVDGQGVAGNFAAGGKVVFGTTTLDSTATVKINGATLSTAADQAVGSLTSGSTITKNDSNTRTFYGHFIKPTFNAGASNLNTTFNILAVDSINTSVTGLTVNLLNLAFGGSTKATIKSDGSFSATSIQTLPNKAILGTVDLGYPNQGGTVVIANGSANQAGDGPTIILGNGSVQCINATINNILMGRNINVTTSGPYRGDAYVLGYYITVADLNSTWTIGGGVSSGSLLVPVTSNTINFGINSTVPTLWISGASGAGTFGQVTIGTTTADSNARVTIVGSILNAQADGAIGTLVAGATVTKNDGNTRQFYGTVYKPTFNTGGANTTTTYNILTVDSVNTSLTGLTVNLLSLNFGGANRVLITSSGATTFVSTSFKIGNVTYIWPSSQGAASTVLTNDGAGNLTWTAPGGGGSIGGSIAANQIAFGSGVNTIAGSASWTYDGTRVALGGNIATGKLFTINGVCIGTMTGLSIEPGNSAGTLATGLNIAFSTATATPSMVGIDMSINCGSSPTTVYGIRFQPAGSLGSLGTAYFLYQSDRRFANYFQGAFTINHDQGLSDSQVALTGTWSPAGTSTTTKPALLVEPSGTTSNSWSTSGTGLGINANTSFVGNLIDVQVNAQSCFRVDYQGCAAVGGLADGNINGNTSSWSNAGSLVINDNSFTTTNTNTSSILAFTVTMPSGPINGKIYIIYGGGGVTTYTLNPNSGQSFFSSTPVTFVADTSMAFMFYNTVWYRLF